MRHTHVVRGTKVVANCRPEADEQAEWLLTRINEIDPLVHGTVLQFGWSRLTFQRDGNSLLVYEPDFDRDPATQLRPDITCSLRVQGQMLEAANRAGAIAQFPKFSEIVAIEPGCLGQSKLVMVRSSERFPNDSGWLVFRGQELQADPETIAIYRLLSLRPALMQALALPQGWLVVFDGDEIIGVQPPPGGETKS